MAKTYKYSRYVAEAKKEPFVLELDDGDQISIQAPSGEVLLEIEEAFSSRRRLELLTGDQYDRVFELVRHAPAGALNGLVSDMVEHFGLSPVPPGGGRASSR
ncbi:hypothetical protein [Saccharopolyspora spinosa]|uniref:Uncharacterized protein n=1 Tax=Saccharopolyspora spinosa TaxID=60894 RepID=A0A2N3XZ11_SACSN|nr:hypothetical protein [Saccharopolyspora spinosa]PKW15923.1 hypothetical protein A8926_3705 [Saccharopolyspora spinosa]